MIEIRISIIKVWSDGAVGQASFPPDLPENTGYCVQFSFLLHFFRDLAKRAASQRLPALFAAPVGPSGSGAGLRRLSDPK
ncbi:hypothetical protein [Paracoccus yeei]|uniref:hypothetical protein n=1 Tax=Paracoccus yeei TaxID=147645 RepID=UPI0011B0E207|nr:hypothetical protein [Paracoccus yeei]